MKITLNDVYQFINNHDETCANNRDNTIPSIVETLSNDYLSIHDDESHDLIKYLLSIDTNELNKISSLCSDERIIYMFQNYVTTPEKIKIFFDMIIK